MVWEIVLPLISGIIFLVTWWGIILFPEDIRLAESKTGDLEDKLMLFIGLLGGAGVALLIVILPNSEGGVGLDYIYLMIPFLVQIPIYFRYGLLE